MRKVKKKRVSTRLKNLQYKLLAIEKSKEYLKRELPRLIEDERNTRDKIKKEKRAIYLVDKAKKLRWLKQFKKFY